MTILGQLTADLKTAMRAGDVTTRDTIRMVLTALKNRRIELGEDLDEKVELQILAKAVKSREDSASQYDTAGREDLATQERAEIEVIRRYLPTALTEEELRAIVEAKIAELGLDSKRQLGQLMKGVMAEHQGRIDGKTVQRIAGELLA